MLFSLTEPSSAPLWAGAPDVVGAALPPSSVLPAWVSWASIALSACTLGWIAWQSFRRRRGRGCGREVERVRVVLDELPEGITILDSQGKIVWMSESTDRLFGWKVAQTVGTSAFDLVHPDDVPRVLERFQDILLEPSRLETIEFRLRTASGGHVPLECTARNLLGVEGIDGILLTGRDLTERALERHQLEEAKLRAEKVLADKKEFLAVLGHEVRTPLQAIFAALDAVHAQTRPGDAARELVDHATKSADGLLQVLDDLLVMSREEAKLVPVRRVEFDPCELTRDVAALFEAAAAKKGGKIRARTTGEPGRMTGDPARIRQILSNLAGNAVRYAGDTEIELSFAVGTDPQGGPVGVWEVADRGPGLQEGDASRLFRKWERGREDIPGSGLGLAIVADIAQAMKGTLEAFSRDGGGLVVRLRLPWTAPESVGSDTHLERFVPRRRAIVAHPKVLVAEDDRTNQVVIRKQLESLGCVPVITGDGAAALARLETETFDMVLLDCQMPVMDGFSAAREIRRLEEARGSTRLPVLAVTAWAMHEDQQLCLQSGMDEVLTKPLRPAVLAEALGRWLGTAHAPEGVTSAVG